MSGAIKKDDEIAAKATQGRWTVGSDVPLSIIYDDDEESVVCSDLNLDGYDAKHIIRLHNRFPLYRALAVLIKEMDPDSHGGFDDEQGGCHFGCRANGILEDHRPDCLLNRIRQAIRALDSEHLDQEGAGT